MDLKQLRYFMAIAEEGQITSAARRLHIAQPPLSQSMKALEQELGVQLFERIPSGIKITEAGAMLLEKGYEITGLMDSIVTDLQSYKNGDSGVLKLGSVSSASAKLVDDNFLAFREHYPNVIINLHEGNSFQIIEYLEKGLIEVGIIRTPFDTDAFEKICCPPMPMVAIGTEHTFPFVPGQSVTINQLADLPLLISRRYYPLFQNIANRYQIAFHYYCINNDARTALSLAAAGYGIAVVPKETLLVKENPQLVYCDVDCPELETQLCTVWRRQKPLSRIAKNFLSYFDNQ